MMKLKAFLIALTMALSPAAFAGGSWNGVTVLNTTASTSERSSPSGNVEFELSAGSTGGPGCATTTNYVVVDVSSPGGAFAAAILQTARLSGVTVNLIGTGTCNGGFSTVEQLSYVSF